MQEHFTDGKWSHGYIWNWWQSQQETHISLLQVSWEIPNKTTALMTKGAEIDNRLHFLRLCLKIEKYLMIPTTQR